LPILDAGEALDEGGLPCAVVADEGHHLAAPHREVHVVQHMDGAEALVEPGQAEDGVSVFSHVVPSSRFRSCPWRAPERPGFPGTRGALSGAGPATRSAGAATGCPRPCTSPRRRPCRGPRP